MQTIDVNGTQIAYIDEGKGIPIVLVHGFASNMTANWVAPGWVSFLAENGFRVVVLDNRGHGASEKFYQSDMYSWELMAGDVSGLIDLLGLDRPHVMGYSMGARISATLASTQSGKLGKVVLAGNGYNMISGDFPWQQVSDDLLAASLEDVTSKTGREFRLFAESTKSDLKALAACVMGRSMNMPEEAFAAISAPVLVIAGEKDDLVKQPEKVAELIPDGRFEQIPRRNHMNAVGDKVYKQKVLEFLIG